MASSNIPDVINISSDDSFLRELGCSSFDLREPIKKHYVKPGIKHSKERALEKANSASNSFTNLVPASYQPCDGSERVGLMQETSSQRLSLPGSPNFSAERSQAVKRKKIAEKFSPFKSTNNKFKDGMKRNLASHKCDELNNSNWSPSPLDDRNVIGNIQSLTCPGFVKSSTLLGDKFNGSASKGFSPLKSRAKKRTYETISSQDSEFVIRHKQPRVHVLNGWPSSSDSSDDEILELLKTKKVKKSSDKCTKKLKGRKVKHSTVCASSEYNDYGTKSSPDKTNACLSGVGNGLLKKQNKRSNSTVAGGPIQYYDDKEYPSIYTLNQKGRVAAASGSQLFEKRQSSESSFKHGAVCTPISPLKVKITHGHGSAKKNGAGFSSWSESPLFTIQRDLHAADGPEQLLVRDRQNQLNAREMDPTSYASTSPVFCSKNKPAKNTKPKTSKLFSGGSVLSHDTGMETLCTHARNCAPVAGSAFTKNSLFGKKKTSPESVDDVKKNQTGATNKSRTAAAAATTTALSSIITSTPDISQQSHTATSGSPLGSKDNPVDVDRLTPETKMALEHLQQMEKDEEMARRIQEELDMEFALSLQNDRDMTARLQTTFDDSSATMSSLGASEFTLDTTGTSTDSSHMWHIHSPARPRGTRRDSQRRRNRNDMSSEELLQSLQDMYQTVNAGARAMPFGAFWHQDSPPRHSRAQANRRGRRHHLWGGAMYSPSGNGEDYEHLMQLAEMIGEAKDKGLSKTDMSRLPVVTYKKSVQVEECNICMADYEDGDSQKILPCFHSYHAKCIDQWIKKNATCPVCRVEIKIHS